MVGNRAGGFLRFLFFIIVIGGIAALAYGAGLNQGAAQVVTVGGADGTAVVPVYVGHVGWGFGFGFFLPFLFILLLIFAFRPRWGRGPGGRGDWRGGHGGWGSHGGPDEHGDDPFASRRRGLEEIHRSLHEADGSPAGKAGGPSPAAPTTGARPPAVRRPAVQRTPHRRPTSPAGSATHAVARPAETGRDQPGPAAYDDRRADDPRGR